VLFQPRSAVDDPDPDLDGAPDLGDPPEELRERGCCWRRGPMGVRDWSSEWEDMLEAMLRVSSELLNHGMASGKSWVGGRVMNSGSFGLMKSKVNKQKKNKTMKSSTIKISSIPNKRLSLIQCLEPGQSVKTLLKPARQGFQTPGAAPYAARGAIGRRQKADEVNRRQ
jgi:hypothetical protein